MPTWVIPLVSMVLALVAQVAGLAFFLGKMKAYQDSNTKLVEQIQSFGNERLATVTKTVGELSAITQKNSLEYAGIDGRLRELQTVTAGLPSFRERFIAFEAAAQVHHERQEADSARIHSAVESLQRQVGSLAVHGPGRLVEIPATKKGPL